MALCTLRLLYMKRFGNVSYAIFELCNHADKRARWEPAQFDPESSKLTTRVMRVRFHANEKRQA